MTGGGVAGVSFGLKAKTIVNNNPMICPTTFVPYLLWMNKPNIANSDTRAAALCRRVVLILLFGRTSHQSTSKTDKSEVNATVSLAPKEL
jgi:hypothetical protein